VIRRTESVPALARPRPRPLGGDGVDDGARITKRVGPSDFRIDRSTGLGGAADQTAIFGSQRELVLEVKRVIGRNLKSGTRDARPRSLSMGGHDPGVTSPGRSGTHLDLGEARLSRKRRSGAYVCRRAADQATPSGQ
jgi:hypothetical protein